MGDPIDPRAWSAGDEYGAPSEYTYGGNEQTKH